MKFLLRLIIRTCAQYESKCYESNDVKFSNDAILHEPDEPGSSPTNAINVSSVLAITTPYVTTNGRITFYG